VQTALAAGVKVVAGTDAGGHDHPANARELECLVDAGMTPLQAIRAGTGLAAECLGWDATVGTVQADRLADLVAMDDDPLRDIRLLQQRDRIRVVWKGGKVCVDRRAGRVAAADDRTARLET
jgi:imidazolonepropionase-like amidohydrolase